MNTIFRANVSQVLHLCTKNGLSEFIPGFRGFPGNGPNRAGPALGSTRAGGKDEGSLHKLPQMIFMCFYCPICVVLMFLEAPTGATPKPLNPKP